MRAAQLLAVGAFCLLASAWPACGRVVQPVGEYSAEQGRAGTSGGGGGRAGFGGNGGGGTSGVTTLDASADLDADITPEASQPGCRFEGLETERHRLDLYLMIDANITLAATGQWELIKQGLRSFAADQRSRPLGVGVRFYGNECNPEAYMQPTVGVDLLANNSAAVQQSVDKLMFNASEMLPALQGGIRHQRMRAANYSAWKQSLVVITDGWTQNLPCLTGPSPFYTLDDLVAAANDGYVQSPSIETYIVGLSNPPPFDMLFVNGLSDIAAAGGTERADVMYLTSASQLNEALQDVRRRAQPCDYLVPPEQDTAELAVAFNGLEIPRVASVTACGDEPGWYLGTASTPARAFLCPASCEPLRDSDRPQVRLLGGCAPRTR